MKRAALGATIIVVTGAAFALACSSNPPDPQGPISLPSRVRDAGKDAPGILEPSDASFDTDAPPVNVFCTQPGIIGCFEFEDSFVDGSGTLTSTTTSTFSYMNGHKGRAIHLEGVDAISFPFSAVLNVTTATVEAWVYRSLAAVGVDTVFDDGDRVAMALLDDGTLRCKTAAAAAKGGSITVEKWTHAACVFDGTTIHAYVDGLEVTTAPGAIAPNSQTTGATIGNDAPSGSEGFSGLVDSLRIFNVVRTPSEIAEAAK